MNEGTQAKPLTELELLRMKANKITDESLESTKRMVQVVDETHKTGATTMEQLAMQGEMLRHTDEQMDVINRDVREAEENLAYLERCCCCVPPWSKSKRIKPNKPLQHKSAPFAPSSGMKRTAPPPPPTLSQGQKYTPGDVNYITRITNDAREDEMEENLKHVAGVVGELNTMAKDMNKEIRVHNEILERIDTKAMNNKSAIAAAQEKAERIVGKPANEQAAPSNTGFGIQAAKMLMK